MLVTTTEKGNASFTYKSLIYQGSDPEGDNSVMQLLSHGHDFATCTCGITKENLMSIKRKEEAQT